VKLSSECSPLPTLSSESSVKRELYNEETTIDSNDNDNDGEHASKKIKLSNDTTNMNEKKKDELDECWVNVGRLGFYLEIPRSDASPKFENDTIQQLSPHSGKMLSLKPHDDSYNPCQIVYKFLVGHLTIFGSTEEMHS
jgi:hypothetical protein